jgi:hypothetical protein
MRGARRWNVERAGRKEGWRGISIMRGKRETYYSNLLFPSPHSTMPSTQMKSAAHSVVAVAAGAGVMSGSVGAADSVEVERSMISTGSEG